MEIPQTQDNGEEETKKPEFREWLSPLGEQQHQQQQQQQQDQQEREQQQDEPPPTQQQQQQQAQQQQREHTPQPSKIYTYKDCQKNHSKETGIKSLDGCGQFLPSPDEPLKCSVCTCHRNFHKVFEQSIDGVVDEAAGIITDFLAKEKKNGEPALALLEEIVKLLVLAKQVAKTASPVEKLNLELVPVAQTPASHPQGMFPGHSQVRTKRTVAGRRQGNGSGQSS